MTSGKTVQSRRNWMKKSLELCWVYFWMTGRRRGWSLRYLAQREKTLSLAGARSSQSHRMCERVPGVGSRWHTGREQDPEESPDQCLDR